MNEPVGELPDQMHATLGANTFEVQGEFTEGLALAFTQWVRASSAPAANDTELATELHAQATRIGSSVTQLGRVAEQIQTTAPETTKPGE